METQSRAFAAADKRGGARKEPPETLPRRSPEARRAPLEVWPRKPPARKEKSLFAKTIVIPAADVGAAKRTSGKGRLAKKCHHCKGTTTRYRNCNYWKLTGKCRKVSVIA
jgi:hypothetical protein